MAEHKSRPPTFSPQRLAAGHSVRQLTDDEIEAVVETFATADTYDKKTLSRRLVENVLSKYKWYFPRRDGPNAPSLSKAYAYFEHITLPRCFVGEDAADHVLRRAEPGESFEDTSLYPWNMASSCFIEWGIGVDLYFSSLRFISLLLLVAGLINIRNIVYFASDEYSPNGHSDLSSVFLTGSAICTTEEWVVCADCVASDFETEDGNARFGVDANGTTLVLRNNCGDPASMAQGLTSLFTLVFMSVAMWIFSWYQRARAVRFDEDKLTSTDYSVIVKNPPEDAYDPDEWRDFFEQFADKQVTAVTVAIDNDVMLQKLLARRRHRNNLKVMLPKGLDMDNEDQVRAAVAELVKQQELEKGGCCVSCATALVLPILNLLGMFLPANTLVDRVFQLTEEIKELHKENYRVCKVFVTFETEEGQRAALSALTVGKVNIMSNNTSAVPPSAAFRGEYVLRVDEPSEPSAVRWLDLKAGIVSRKIRQIITLVITMAVVAICGVAVGRARSWLGPAFSGPLVTIFNSIIPQIVKLLMLLELHHDEGTWQTSLYFKITLFRWINTAILTKWITPFTDTIGFSKRAVLPSINAVLISELWLTPLLRLSDWFTNLKKHFLAPRAWTQEQMNMNFQGTFYNLGERYTDLTKILFVVCYYAALYPMGFFFGFAILTIQYYADKWCLLRIWGHTPIIGPELATFSRRYFFSGSLLALSIVSAYTWMQFPYDNVCDSVNPPPGEDFSGDYTNVKFTNDTTSAVVTVTQQTQVYFCSQDWRDPDGFPFPPGSDSQPSGFTWMTDDQETVTNMFGIYSLIFTIIFVVVLFGWQIYKLFASLFRGIQESSGQIQRIDFSSNTEIFGYVPQIKLNAFPFPFLACDIDQIDQGLIGWNDPAKSYDHYNLIFDVPWPGMRRQELIVGNTRDARQIENHRKQFARNLSQRIDSEPRSATARPIFSVIKHYPPPWQKRLIESELDNSGTREAKKAK